MNWKVTRDKQVADASESYGTTVHSSQTINVEPTITQVHSEQTLLHEVLHAIWASMALRHIVDMNKDKEEHIVSALANGFYHVLKDNKINFSE